jgi:hypothetical protein
MLYKHSARCNFVLFMEPSQELTQRIGSVDAFLNNLIGLFKS